MPSFNLKGKVSLDSTDFQAGLRRVKLASAATAKTIGNGFRGIVGVLQKVTATLAKFATIAATITFAAATAGAVKLGRELKKAFEIGGNLSDLSARTGIAVKDLVVLEQAFEDAGVSGDQVGITLNRLTRRTQIATQGNNAYAKALETLGLNAQKLAQMDQASRFWEVANAMNRLGINSETTAAAMDLLDTSAGELFGLFQDANALENASKTIGSQADILDKNAQTFDRIADLLNSAGTKLQGFFVGIASVAAPKILEVLEKFNTLDLAAVGQNIAKNLNMENALEVIKAAFQVAAAFLGNAILEALARAITAFGELWGEMSTQWVDGLKNGLKEGLARALVAVLAPFGVVIAGLDGLAKGKQAKADLGAKVEDFFNDKLDGDFFGLEEATKNLRGAIEVLTKPSGPPNTPAGGTPGATAEPGGSLPAPTGGGHHAIDKLLSQGEEKPSKRVSRLDQYRDAFARAPKALMPALPNKPQDLSAFDKLQAAKAAGVGVGENDNFATTGLNNRKIFGKRAGAVSRLGLNGISGGLGAARAVHQKAAADAAEGKRVFQDQLAAANEQIRIQEEELTLLREALSN